jgi:hypothetical protein
VIGYTSPVIKTREAGMLVRLSVIALGVACTISAAAARTKPKLTDIGPVKTSIYIGNSFFYYNNSMHSHVLGMSRAADPNRTAYRAASVTISGSGFDWHDTEGYFRPNAIGRYSFDEDNNIVFNKLDKLFDVAIMMDCSQCPLHPQLKSASPNSPERAPKPRAKTARSRCISCRGPMPTSPR